MRWLLAWLVLLSGPTGVNAQQFPPGEPRALVNLMILVYPSPPSMYGPDATCVSLGRGILAIGTRQNMMAPPLATPVATSIPSSGLQPISFQWLPQNTSNGEETLDLPTSNLREGRTVNISGGEYCYKLAHNGWPTPDPSAAERRLLARYVELQITFTSMPEPTH